MCAIFGLIDYAKCFTAKQRERVLKVLSKECEERGTDATGFAFNTADHLTIYKRPLAAHKLKLHLPSEANIILGHTRMATQGDKALNYNNHPFLGHASGMPFALAHNGVLYNDRELRKEQNLPVTHIETDSYIAVQLLERSKALNPETIARMAEKIEGSFVFTVLDRLNNSYFVKGDNPLALYHFEKYGFYIYASTDKILLNTLIKLGLAKYHYTEIKASCGDILKIDSDGNISQTKFDISNMLEREYRFSSMWYRTMPQDYDDSISIRQLKEFAFSIGVEADDIDLLLDYGYTEEEIEELLYYPDTLFEAVMEVKGYFDYDYDYCYEL